MSDLLIKYKMIIHLNSLMRYEVESKLYDEYPTEIEIGEEVDKYEMDGDGTKVEYIEVKKIYIPKRDKQGGVYSDS